jgi:hypothetical protein
MPYTSALLAIAGKDSQEDHDKLEEFETETQDLRQ